MDFHPELKPGIGADGLMVESPIITLTEKVLEEKELQLRKHIQDNYLKIRDVERELSNLTLEVKLTAGPKKAALEHLRKKIELSADKIKAAKLKEIQAKKAWDAAAKVLQDEEDYKAGLCDDLNRLVQESAAAQYTRLEDLTRRLEALNPQKAGLDSDIAAAEDGSLNNSKSTGKGHDEKSPAQGNGHATSREHDDTLTGRGAPMGAPMGSPMGTPMGAPMRNPTDPQEQLGRGSLISSPDSPGPGWKGSPGRHGGRGAGAVRPKGALVQSRHKALETAWTGAGFDVHDSQT
eukprot:TRINITY_DN11948_c0_g1_i1.p1 TRINITY_DN11948_c0_g1~~TRINITY_DN11948_c0_g1_i1.p1  ORF type:complete len:292 (-),score=55.09 TRINITY_DN11948_c0_g1_i1:56-931(-)